LQRLVKTAPADNWLIRISGIFSGVESDILRNLGASPIKKLGREFLLVRIKDPAVLQHSAAAKFVRWNIPVHHSWPCCPRDIPGFIEKAAQALLRKLGQSRPQTIMAGPLDPDESNGYYRALASNLRGRMLQVFSPQMSGVMDAAAQDCQAPTLFCLVGSQGLFCGLQSPAASRGFYPGGTKFIRQNAPGTISRAGAKIAEALHQLQLDRPLPAPGSHWLELGASPGGMTAELLARDYRVTAVDKAPLDKRLDHAPGLRFVLAKADTFLPPADDVYDAILSDMNGHAAESIRHVIRFAKDLRPHGLVVFTLKLTGAATFIAINDIEKRVLDHAADAGLRVFSRTHLTYNRREFTFLFEPEPVDSVPPQST
jgi:hypothetical protein